MTRIIPITCLALGAVATAALFGACDSAVDAGESGTFYGASVTLGGGTVRSYVVMQGGAPRELGVAIDQAAMATLPQGEDGHAAALELPLPTQAGATPYRLLEVDWNAHGHAPAGVYDQPHFDFHFYTISLQERNAIDPADPQFGQKAANHPPAEQLPQGYIALAGAVPRMGVHWADPASPELHGQPFTQTFIYGSWDGRVTFMEPMVTRAFLESRPSYQAGVPQPQRFAQPGIYPATRHIYWDGASQTYRVSLENFTARQ